jgi:hypothetical protein
LRHADLLRERNDSRPNQAQREVATFGFNRGSADLGCIAPDTRPSAA